MKKSTLASYEKGFASLIILVLVLISVAVVGMYYFSPEEIITDRQSQSDTNVSLSDTQAPSLIPFLFPELTIPYLRNRTYESSLGELSLYQNNSAYTSYLTQYDSDGLKINALLTIPKSEMPDKGWPAIVFVHGYIPPTTYRTIENYNAYVDYFARNNFVVFKIDLRGHGDSEGIATGAYYSGDYVIDTLNAVAALQSNELVNPDAIGLWGHSMAGNVTFRAFIASNEISSIVIWAGAVYTYEDMAEYRIQDNSYRPPTDDTERQRFRDELNAVHGSFNSDDDFWKQVVPTNYLESKTGSIQIHHATDDAVVNVGYSRNLLDVIAGSKINTTLHEYPTGGHNISGASFTTAMQRSVEFFRDTL